MTEVGGSAYCLYKRKREERNPELFKWESRAQRRKESRLKKVETDLFGAREKRENESDFFSSIKYDLFTLMNQRGLCSNPAAQKELMVSFGGSRAEGRNLNALG